MTRRRRVTTTLALALGGLLLAAGAGAKHGRDDDDRDHERRHGRVEVDRWDAGAAVATRSGRFEIRVRGGDDGYRRGRRGPVYFADRYHYHWDDDRHRGHDRRSLHVPPGHLPPPGLCKVWYPGVPPGHQPPPTECWRAERTAWHTGGTVIYGDPVCRH